MYMLSKKEKFNCMTIAIAGILVISLIAYLMQIQKKQFEGLTMKEKHYYLDTIKRMINTNSNSKRRDLLSENALNVKALDDTAKFIYAH